MKQSTAGFIRDLVINFLAIFLGIIITFAVQARIDRSLDKKDIRAFNFPLILFISTFKFAIPLILKLLVK